MAIEQTGQRFKVGAVNFNILHSVLHIIIQQLNAKDLNIEFQGNDANRIETLLNRNRPSIQVTISDPSIVLEKSESVTLSTSDTTLEPSLMQATEESDQNLTVSKSQTLLVQTLNVPASHVTDLTFASKEVVKKVETRVQKLEKKLFDTFDIPTNTQIIETLKSRSQHSGLDKSRPIFEIWHTLNLNKRVEAVEAAIEKVSGFVEELVRITPTRQLTSISSKTLTEGFDLNQYFDEEYHHDNILDSLETLLKEKGGVEVFFQNIDQIRQQISDWKNMFDEMELDNLKCRLDDIETNMQEVISRLNVLADLQPNQLKDKVENLENSLIEANHNLQDLSDKNDEQCRNYEVVLEKIDLLKAVKANYEDVEDALNEKADLSELNRKVSIGKFDEAFEENVKTIEEILRKLQELEELCQNNLNEIQLELAVKPNRSDLDTVQELLMKRINELKLRLKSLTALKEEQEASGAKNPYLRDLNCISCDNDVYMCKELKAPLIPRRKQLPPAKNYNLPTFISYKLESLRNQERGPCTLNLNQFEKAIDREKKDLINRKFANMGRTCGGKYTVTAPSERVTKIGNFLSQWGQCCDNVEHTLIQGTDGKMYKAVNMLPTDDNCECYYENEVKPCFDNQ